MTRTRESTRGGGQNALRGSARPATSDQHRKRSAEVVRRTCDHAKRPAWRPKMGSVALHHGHRVGSETTPQILRSPSMQLHGDDMRTSRDQRLGQRTGTGTDVEHQLARANSSVRYEPSRPLVTKRMPSPGPAWPPGRGHRKPSRRSNTCRPRYGRRRAPTTSFSGRRPRRCCLLADGGLGTQLARRSTPTRSPRKHNRGGRHPDH
jgi:hypothetical protein